MAYLLGKGLLAHVYLLFLLLAIGSHVQPVCGGKVTWTFSQMIDAMFGHNVRNIGFVDGDIQNSGFHLLNEKKLKNLHFAKLHVKRHFNISVVKKMIFNLSRSCFF